MKLIGAEIMPDLRNLIGAFVSENFLIENRTFADPKSSQAKKLRIRRIPKVRGRAKENLSNTFMFVGRLLLREAKDRPCQI